MANVIKHKRGSGSDPVASDLVVGEVAIRTDVGKLFTKMDNGSVAEIAGGGSDIAINTLSSSSGTGGGSATFNGSAFRFTLSSPPSVSAQQLLVSINGVIQKPVAGTGQPSEGFSVDGTDIILGDAPETGADFFILTFKSLGVSEPADNSVTTAKILNGTILNEDISASAAIAGTKISPDFGSQTITTTGDLTIDTNTLHVDSFNNRVGIGTTSEAGVFHINLGTDKNIVYSGGIGEIGSVAGFQTLNDAASALTGFGIRASEIRFAIGSSERMRIDSSGRVGIGTTNPSASDNFADNLTVTSSDSNVGITILGSTSSRIHFGDGTSGDANRRGQINYLHSDDAFAFLTSATERMRIDSSGRVLIGTTVDNSFKFKISDGGGFEFAMLPNDSGVNNFTNYDRANNAYVPLFTNAADHRFGITGTEKMRIDSSGRVGIGTSSPSTKFVVSNSGAEGFEFSHSSGTNELNSFNRNTSGRSPIDIIGQTFKVITGNPSLTTGLFQDSSGHVGIGTTSTPSVVSIKDTITGVQPIDDTQTITIQTGATSGAENTGTGIMFLNHNGSSGSGGGTFGGTISCVKENSTVGNTANCMRFATRPNGGGVTERMRISSSGNLSIGETGEPAAGTDGIQLRADGTVKMSSTGSGERNAFEFKNANGVVGKIVTQNSNTTFSTSSDYRLKENVVAISDGITRLKQLKPSRFNFIVEKDLTQDGFLAHEVQSVVPEAISGGKDAVKEDGSIDPQGIDQGKLVPLLVAALQEAIGRIEVLEAK